MGAMPEFRGLKILDYIAIILFAAMVAFSIPWSAGNRSGTLRVEVEASGVLNVMPLSEDGDLVVQGPVGETHIQVRDGAVAITESDCPNKICITMGAISRPSGWVACLPNRVFVRIVAVGEEKNGEAVDATAF